jgi:hypothetical protein
MCRVPRPEEPRSLAQLCTCLASVILRPEGPREHSPGFSLGLPENVLSGRLPRQTGKPSGAVILDVRAKRLTLNTYQALARLIRKDAQPCRGKTNFLAPWMALNTYAQDSKPGRLAYVSKASRLTPSVTAAPAQPPTSPSRPRFTGPGRGKAGRFTYTSLYRFTEAKRRPQPEDHNKILFSFPAH